MVACIELGYFVQTDENVAKWRPWGKVTTETLNDGGWRGDASGIKRVYRILHCFSDNREVGLLEGGDIADTLWL
jgi:hypothetical protein